MMQPLKDKNTNFEIAQLFHMIHSFKELNEKCIKWNIERVIDINQTVLATKYLQANKPEFINGTILHLAYFSNNKEAFDIFLKYNADFTLTNQVGPTVIHQVIHKTCIDSNNTWKLKGQLQNHFVDAVLSAHIQFNNSINPCDSNGISHFHAACMSNNAKAVEFFLSNGVCVDQSINKSSLILSGYTALHIAVKCCSIEVVEVLLKYNASVNSIDAKGLSPFYILIEQKMRIIEKKQYQELMNVYDKLLCLLTLNDINNECTNSIDGNGLSLLHIASVMKDFRLMRKLFEMKVDVNQSVNLDSPIWPGFTALHFAAYCNPGAFHLLVIEGADVGLKNPNGVTLLDVCMCNMKTKLSNVDVIIRSLLSSSKLVKMKIMSKLSVPSNSNIWSGYTSLHLAIILLDDERFEDVEILLKNGADVCVKDSRGWTPLHLAVRLQKTNFVTSMLKYHRDAVNPTDDEDLSHLHILCTDIKSKNLIEKLLSAGTDVNIVYKGKTLLGIHEKSTPLHVALYYHNYEVAMLLSTHGADVYAKDINDLTPLHHFLDNSYVIPEPLYEILFSNSDLRNNFYARTGLDVLHIACASYSNNVFPVRHLLNSGVDINRKFNCNDQSFYKQFANFTPLQFAINIGSKKIADLLISRGADLFLENPTFFASFSKSYTSYLKCLIMETKDIPILQRFEKDLNLTPLHIACCNIDVERIKNLLKTDLNVNAQIVSDSPIWPESTPLHVLLQRYFDEDDNLNTKELNFPFGLLLDKGADVTLTDAEQMSSLHMAFNLFKHGKLQFSQISKILKSQKNFHVNPVNNESISHLCIAGVLGDTATMTNFLNHGANVNEGADIFSSGYPSLLHAVLNSHKISGVYDEKSLQCLKAVRLLLEYGADVAVVDRQGNTALHVIAENFQSSSRESLVKEMIDCGCDGTVRNMNGESAFEIILRKHDCTVKEFELFLKQLNYLNIFNPITEEGLIGLVFSNPNLCEIAFDLIEKRPYIAKTDDMGRTIIHNIFSVDEHVFYKQQFYLECGKIVDCDINAQDKLGRAALHLASKSYRGVAVSDLLTAGANVNIIDAKGFTPLHIALQHKNTEAACALLNGGADANIIDAAGDAPLHIAIRQKMIEAIHALLKSGADANIVGAHGNTPLHIAAQWDNVKLISALLNRGADIDATDDGGKTPLFHATLLLKSKAVNELLSVGADIEIKDIKGKTSVQYARIYYDPQVMKTFETHIHKLMHCGFDLTQLNVHLNSLFLHDLPHSSKIFEQQFEEMKNMIIEPYSLSLHDYFSKIHTMVKNPYKSQFKCQAIKEFFKSNENQEFSKKYSEMMPILNLLNRKAVKVLELIEQTRVSLNEIVGMPLPDLCFQAILKYLDKASMKNLIDSTADVKCSSRE